MSNPTMYRDVLLDHYRNPRNRGDLGDAEVVARGSNPRCGDELEVGINFSDDILQKVQFRGRGCSVCLASASLMTEAVAGANTAEAERLYTEMKVWFEDGAGDSEVNPPETLQALDAVRGHPARRRCVLLAWEALHDAIHQR